MMHGCDPAQCARSTLFVEPWLQRACECVRVYDCMGWEGAGGGLDAAAVAAAVVEVGPSRSFLSTIP